MGADMITNDDMRRFAEFMLAHWLERDPAAGKMRKRPKMKEPFPRSKKRIAITATTPRDLELRQISRSAIGVENARVTLLRQPGRNGPETRLKSFQDRLKRGRQAKSLRNLECVVRSANVEEIVHPDAQHIYPDI
jgi:hypothetical protein